MGKLMYFYTIFFGEEDLNRVLTIFFFLFRVIILI